MRYGTFLPFFLLMLLLNAGCHQNRPAKGSKTHTFTVKQETLHKSLYFTGTIQPLKEQSITCPMNAVIQSVQVHYGQWVKKGEIIATLHSPELQKQYNEALTTYLKAKDDYSIAQAKFAGTQSLWDAGLIAKNNFLNEQSSLATTRITLMQAKLRLADMVVKVDEEHALAFSSLTLSEFSEVKNALKGEHNTIHLKAPINGLLLYPPKSTDESTRQLSTGMSLKSGDVFALVGDLTGIQVEINIPEVDIAYVQPGMKAHITGVALANTVLDGHVVAVNAQASNNDNNGLPSFHAIIEVPRLLPKDRPLIKVGMSASIELMIEEKKALFIPIHAVHYSEGHSIVTVKTKEGPVTTRIITTGSAQANTVVVLSGLQEGDVIIA